MSNQAAEEEVTPKTVCYKCKKSSEETIVSNCSASKCSRMICNDCHTNFCESKQLPLLVKEQTGVIITCPNKKCYDMAKKETSGVDPQRLHWERDGCNGPDDPNNSMRILLNWLTSEGNYKRFCGKDSLGTKKVQFGTIISNIINSHKVRISRTPKDVLNKIHYLENQFREASDWMNNTGQGVTDEEQFTSYVKKLCPYYDDLKAVMDDRNGTRPKVTSDDFDADEGSDSNDSDVEVVEAEEVAEEVGDETTSVVLDAGIQPLPGTIVFESPKPKTIKRRQKSGASASHADSSVFSRTSKRSNYLFDDFVTNYISNQEKMVDETTRHNKQMESLELQKMKEMRNLEEEKMRRAEASGVWKVQTEELQFKTILYEKFELLKDKIPKERLVKMFPAMASFFDNNDGGTLEMETTGKSGRDDT